MAEILTASLYPYISCIFDSPSARDFFLLIFLLRRHVLFGKHPYDSPMADLNKALKTNIEGDFFVDSTCIDCDTCRQLAPHTFKEQGEYSSVYHQPQSLQEKKEAYHALLSCPTGSIGKINDNQAKTHLADFPIQVDGPVYYLGFNSPKSFGGNSYLIVHPEGNWMIDSPKYLPHLKNKIEALGGIRYLFLTHQDDVADAEQYAKAFGAKRIIHQLDQKAQPEAEWILEGTQPITVSDSDIQLIPTPGHSKGHTCLLFQNKYLFTGDHLYWHREKNCLSAYRDYCWHSWPEQIKSMKVLSHYDFEWILPGHGQRTHLPKEDKPHQFEQLLLWMNQVA
jgi:glyoxylase-like metal-dependent hydrolase (beta-lactamase superfamily II)/ferredoxin